MEAIWQVFGMDGHSMTIRLLLAGTPEDDERLGSGVCAHIRQAMSRNLSSIIVPYRTTTDEMARMPYDCKLVIGRPSHVRICQRPRKKTGACIAQIVMMALLTRSTCPSRRRREWLTQVAHAAE
ncbi:MAG: hypothetical protein UHS51_12855, partial [Atopobiaceae bacterium]|nr:hypothetical protein [Atopobiaceae bacterium]